MRTSLTIIAIAAGVVTIIPFILFAVYMFDENLRLKSWRKTIVRGMDVIIDNGIDIFRARIAWAGAGWVRVVMQNGKTAAYGINSVYPLNYVQNDEEDYENSNHQAV